VNETDIRNELHRELDGAPSWQLNPDEVERRATRRARRRTAMTAVTVVAALGVTAASLYVLSSGGSGGSTPVPGDSSGGLAVTVPATSAPPPATTAPPPGPAAVAAFTCDENGIQPAELTVAAGPGGVAVSVDASGPTAFSLGDAGTNAPVGGHAIEYPGGGRYWPLAPGDYTAKCVVASAGDPDQVAGATVHVVDPNGYYVAAPFGCENHFTAFIDFAPNGSTLVQAVHDALDPYAKKRRSRKVSSASGTTAAATTTARSFSTPCP